MCNNSSVIQSAGRLVSMNATYCICGRDSNMGYRFPNKAHQYREPHGRLGCVLVLLTIELIIGFLSLASRSYLVSGQARQHRTPSPPAYHASLTPRPTSIPKPTPTPRPTLAPAPSSTPPPGSDVVSYPVFNGNTHVPEIALSFDDGPTPPYTSQILNVLNSYNVQATFFVIGLRVTVYPDLVRQEYEQGNAIGNHTWTHPKLTRLSSAEVRSELQKTSDAIKSVIGVAPTVFRPPYEEFNASVQSIAASLGLSTVLWNVDPRDWAVPGTKAIIANVLHSVHDGSIIEMHDGGGNRSETVAALPTIITTLEQRGFRFVTIPRLIANLSTASIVTPQSQIALAGSPGIVSMLSFSCQCSALERPFSCLGLPVRKLRRTEGDIADGHLRRSASA